MNSWTRGQRKGWSTCCSFDRDRLVLGALPRSFGSFWKGLEMCLLRLRNSLTLASNVLRPLCVWADVVLHRGWPPWPETTALSSSGSEWEGGWITEDSSLRIVRQVMWAKPYAEVPAAAVEEEGGGSAHSGSRRLSSQDSTALFLSVKF